MVAIGDLVDDTSVAGAGDGETPQNQGTSIPRNLGPSAPPPRRQGAPTSMRSWLKRVSLRLSSRRSTARCGCFAPPSLERPPHAACAS
jgi:hypothetical protein